MRISWVLGALALLACCAALRDRGADSPVFEIRFTESALADPFTGRALVFLSKTEPEPRTAANWARLDPVFGADFHSVAAGEPMTLNGSNAVCFPVPLPDLEGGRYTAQAVLDVNRSSPAPGAAPGNPCSAPVPIEIHRGADARVLLVCDRTIPRPEIHPTRYCRLFEIQSALLSSFHGRPITLRALVHLPDAWFTEPEREFPLYVFLSGFGASIEGFDFVEWPAPPLEGVPMLMVYPDPSWPSGHCGFADSDNNGPCGQAFVEELIPAIEREFRGIGEPGARLLAGHSTGGWSALWLMTSHPDSFGYAWVASPDPVDFRDFMGIDLYHPGANLFYDEQGRMRPFCRIGNAWTIGFTKEHSDRERVLRGGVLSFFEALYSPKGPDGLPVPLWDRESGAVRPEVAQAWARFDIGRILHERWTELGPKLDGKLAITMGEQDTFLLQGSVALFERHLEELGAGFRVHWLPGDHFSVRSGELFGEEIRALVSAYNQWNERRDEAGRSPSGQTHE